MSMTAECCPQAQIALGPVDADDVGVRNRSGAVQLLRIVRLEMLVVLKVEVFRVRFDVHPIHLRICHLRYLACMP